MRDPAPFSSLESRTAAERHAVLTAVLDIAADAIVVCDQAMRVVLFSAAAERLFGHTAAEVVGRSVQMLVPERYRHAHGNMMAGFLAGETVRGALDTHRRIAALHADGREVPCEGRLSLVTVGEEHLITVTLRDLGAVRRTDQLDQEWVQDRTRIEHFAVSAPGTMFSVDVDAQGVPHFTWVSPRVAMLTGRNPAAFLGDPSLMFGFVHPDDLPRVVETIRDAAQAGRDWNCEFRAGRADHGWMWVEGRAALEPPPRDGRRTYHGFFIDISDRKRAQEAVQARESEMRLALDAAQLGTWRHDLASGTMTFDERGRRHAGVETSTASIEEAMARLHPADVPVLRQTMAAVLDPAGSGIGMHEHRVLTDTGAERWLAVHARAEFEGVGDRRRAVFVHGTTQDITARRLADQALQQSERSFRQMAETVGQVFWMASGPDREVHYVSPAFQHVWGRTAAALYRNPGLWLESVLPADRARVRHAFEALATDGHYDVEFRIVRPDGAVRWINDRGYRQRDTNAQVRLSSGVATDVTERREAEEAVKRFVSGSPTVIYAWQAGPSALRHVWTSGNIATVTGHVPPESDDALWWMPHVHAEDRERVQAAHSAPYDSDHQVLEFRYTRGDGQAIWIRDEKRLFRDDRGRAAEIIGSWTDVTARIELEEQLRQAQKMEAVGRLAGGIAHDFNNLLTVICGTSELVLMDTAEDDPVHALVGEIQRAGQRAVGLTRQLLAFSRKQVLDLKVVDLNVVVTNVESMLRRVIGEDVTLVTDVAETPVMVQVDPGQMEQVLLNLAVNARDAMPRGGQLTIDTSTFVMTPEYCQARPGSRPGLYARLGVRDTGTGMTPEVRARLFEPFFTTKGPGKGTGLGLAMVFGIIKQSDGYIDVWTEVNQGSAFTLYLPSWTAPAVETPVPAAAPGGAPRGHETILLVEDEAAVRKLTRRALESFGYHVLEAGGGPAALELAASHPGTIALLVTDVVMPQMSGPEVAAALEATHPGIRVLFVSGYIDDAIVRHGVVEGTHSFLQKPYLPATLATKVREILDRR